MALVLALAGLSGVLSHVVAGRTREIGVRLALGAERGADQAAGALGGIGPVWLGLVAGLGLGAIARAAMQPMFRQLVPAVDLSLFVVIPVFFLVAGVVACYVPARRASRINPNTALRTV